MSRNLIKKLLFDEEGYSTVEILIIIAAIGGLVTVVMQGLRTSLVGENENGGATHQVGTQIENMIDKWDD